MNTSGEFDISKVIIRRAKRSDLTEITVLEAEIFPDAWPYSGFEELFNDDQCIIMTAEYNSKVVGYAINLLEFGEARLANIAVASNFRTKSIAKKLLNSILDIAKNAGCKNIFLDVRPSNKTAIGFYRRFGFFELYRRPNYYIKPPEDAIVMVRSLD
jgi:ribosomal-protein-alanine N-acetyltransferase